MNNGQIFPKFRVNIVCPCELREANDCEHDQWRDHGLARVRPSNQRYLRPRCGRVCGSELLLSYYTAAAAAVTQTVTQTLTQTLLSSLLSIPLCSTHLSFPSLVATTVRTAL